MNPIPFRRLQSTIAYNPLSSQLQPKPWAAGRILPSGVVISNSGQQSSLSLTRTPGFPQGHFRVSWGAGHPLGDNYGVIVSTSANDHTAKYHSVSATSFQLTISMSGGLDEDPSEFTFMTLP